MRHSKFIATPQFVLSLVLMSLALVFGGGQGTLGDSLAQITAVALLVLLYRANPDLKASPESQWLGALAVDSPHHFFIAAARCADRARCGAQPAKPNAWIGHR